MNIAPRGPLQFEGGQSFDVGDNYHRDMLDWREEAYREANRFKELAPEDGRVKTYMKYIEGDHWEQFGRRAAYKSRVYVNKVATARTAHLALLTDSRPDIEVGCEVPEYEATANVIDRLIRKEYVANKMDLALVSVADIAATTGTGFWKIGSASPGMMRVTPCGPDMVMPIQPGFSIQESTAVLYRTYKSLVETTLKFPSRATDLARQAKSMVSMESTQYHKPEHMDEWTWQRMAPQMRKHIGKKMSVHQPMDQTGFFKGVEWQEYYIEDPSRNQSNRPVTMRDPHIPLDGHNWWYVVQPGERLYPRKRLVIFAGDCLVYDGPAPYWHGLFPFACLRLNPVFWSFWGLSKYRDMLPVNSAINDILAGVLDTIKKALNPTVIAKGSSITKAAWDQFFPDMPGAKLYLSNQMANPASDIRFSDPPVLPQYVFSMLAQYLGPEFDRLSGMLDISTLGGKNQVPGGDTIEQMRDSMQSAPRLEGRYIESFLSDVGLQAVSNILQFYTAKRRLALLGKDAVTPTDFDPKPGTLIPSEENRFDFWKNFPVTIEPGSLHGGARDRSKLMAINLFSSGAISRQKLLDTLEIKDIGNEELAAERATLMGAGMQQEAGPRLSRGQRNGEGV